MNLSCGYDDERTSSVPKGIRRSVPSTDGTRQKASTAPTMTYSDSQLSPPEAGTTPSMLPHLYTLQAKFLNYFQSNPKQSGWQATVQPPERVFSVSKLTTSLQLAQPNLSQREAVKRSMTFESEGLLLATDKNQYNHMIGKQLQLFRTTCEAQAQKSMDQTISRDWSGQQQVPNVQTQGLDVGEARTATQEHDAGRSSQVEMNSRPSHKKPCKVLRSGLHLGDGFLDLFKITDQLCLEVVSQSNPGRLLVSVSIHHSTNYEISFGHIIRWEEPDRTDLALGFLGAASIQVAADAMASINMAQKHLASQHQFEIVRSTSIP
jgi:hypothetical protein